MLVRGFFLCFVFAFGKSGLRGIIMCRFKDYMRVFYIIQQQISKYTRHLFSYFVQYSKIMINCLKIYLEENNKALVKICWNNYFIHMLIFKMNNVLFTGL